MASLFDSAADAVIMNSWRIFRIPILIGVLSTLGLVAALVSDGPMDVLWTLLVAAPLAAVVVVSIR